MFMLSREKKEINPFLWLKTVMLHL